jgi:hypothetical protein
MIEADRVHSTPPTRTPISQNSPVDPTRRHFLTTAAGASVASVGTLAVAAMPAPDSGACVADPIYAAIERHQAAAIVWAAAEDVWAKFPDGPEPMTIERRISGRLDRGLPRHD